MQVALAYWFCKLQRVKEAVFDNLSHFDFDGELNPTRLQ